MNQNGLNYRWDEMKSKSSSSAAMINNNNNRMMINRNQYGQQSSNHVNQHSNSHHLNHNQLNQPSSRDQLNQLLLSLRELIEWVIKKRTELNSMATINGGCCGDVNLISKQLDELNGFKMSIEEERPIIETTLMSARSYLSKDDPQGLDYIEDEIRGGGHHHYRVNGVTFMDDEALRKTTRSIRREVKKLTEKWSELLQLTEQRQRRLDDLLRKMISLQKQMDDLTGKLHAAEISKSKWLPISDIILDRLPEQLGELENFRDNIYQYQMYIDSMNETASRITGSNVLLSHVNLNRLEELNSRWKMITISADERRKGLEQAINDQGSTVGQSFLNDNLEHPWERAVDPNNKVPYYINHATETTHWDHPKMIDLMNSLIDYNEIRYSAYRTAIKLRTIQRCLNIDYLHLGSLIKIFDDHGLHGQNDKLISVPEIINCLQTVYEGTMINSDQASLIDIPLSINLCLNWLLNLFDTANRTGFIRVFSFKVGLTTLCKGALEDKYRFMFRLIADVHGFADERKLGCLLYELIQVPRLLGEINAFGGSNIEPSVRSCFELAGYKSDIDSTDFLTWLQCEPESTVWLPVFHRLVAAEGAKHQAKCNVCKQFPIIGFRYKCLLCFNFDMCQLCFLSDRIAKGHKIDHPMQEYCLATSSGEGVRDFTRIICNKFRSKSHFRRNSAKYNYLPVQSTMVTNVNPALQELDSDDYLLDNSSINSPSNNLNHQQHQIPVDMHSKIEMYANRLAEVELNNNYPDHNQLEEPNDVDHQIMGQYCQPLSSDYTFNLNQHNPGQVIGSIETEERKELESIIHSLEQENRVLQSEYERLKAEKNQPANGKPYPMIAGIDSCTTSDLDPYSSSNSSCREEALIAEAKALRLRKDELETKKLLLEEKNKQLESTLKQLRSYLHSESDENLATGDLLATRIGTDRYSSSTHRIPPTTRYYSDSHYTNNSFHYRSNHYHQPPPPPPHQSNHYLDDIR